MKRVNIDAKVRTFNMHIISIQFLFAVGMIKSKPAIFTFWVATMLFFICIQQGLGMRQ